MFVQNMPIHLRSVGQFVFPAEHCAGAHHQAEGDASSRIQPVHESRESHPHPGASPGNSVRSDSLQARRTNLLWNIWLHHEHIHALPGERMCKRFVWFLFKAITRKLNFLKSWFWCINIMHKQCHYLISLVIHIDFLISAALLADIPFSRWLCLC